MWAISHIPLNVYHKRLESDITAYDWKLLISNQQYFASFMHASNAEFTGWKEMENYVNFSSNAMKKSNKN